MIQPSLLSPVQALLQAWYSLPSDAMPTSLFLHVQKLQRAIEQINAIGAAPLPELVPITFLGETLGYAPQVMVPQLQAACKNPWTLNSASVQMGGDQSMLLDFGPQDA